MSDAYQTETREAHGRTWKVEWFYDEDTGAPWKEHDGHGPVSDWERREKTPGEMILNSDRGSKRFYDFQAAVKQAREEGWNVAPYIWPSKGAQAAAAALADFKRLYGWCNDKWHWCGVRVTLEDTDIDASLWGIESDAEDYFEEVIADLMADCMAQVEKQTYPVTECGV